MGIIRRRMGFVSGFLFSYLVFTTVLYFALRLSGHQPKSYFHIMLLTTLIVLAGTGIRRLQ